ncbi:CPBP family intramembrane glutamic endopeptidase [Bacillus sp. 165]|uniref:CPBP family intramembrane glutamic endopeptidase n=1 Tax=Bacillus sp. 165 TaxID=1529117 RepID=UPI001FFDED0C|nr:CPBP family intramembrane glutamic endopeptidase [Bacillus sp. 165]
MIKRDSLIQTMTDRELRLNLYITQLILLGISGVLIFLLFDNVRDILHFWKWQPLFILMWGGGAALLIVGIDFLAMKMLPESTFDDGGINERMFQGISVPHLLLLTLFIGFTEELLFRGIIQTQFGIGIASIVFAVLHVRYITKPFLFTFVIIISIGFGLLFEYTNNLFITIFAHFLVDFIMGLYLRKEDGLSKDA